MVIWLSPVFLGCPTFKNEAEGAEDDLQVSMLV